MKNDLCTYSSGKAKWTKYWHSEYVDSMDSLKSLNLCGSIPASSRHCDSAFNLLTVLLGWLCHWVTWLIHLSAHIVFLIKTPDQLINGGSSWWGRTIKKVKTSNTNKQNKIWLCNSIQLKKKRKKKRHSPFLEDGGDRDLNSRINSQYFGTQSQPQSLSNYYISFRFFLFLLSVVWCKAISNGIYVHLSVFCSQLLLVSW